MCRIVPDDKKPEVVCELDERLLTTPPVALARCKEVAEDMANCAVAAMKQSIAVAILLLALPYAIDKKYIRYYLHDSY